MEIKDKNYYTNLCQKYKTNYNTPIAMNDDLLKIYDYLQGFRAERITDQLDELSGCFIDNTKGFYERNFDLRRVQIVDERCAQEEINRQRYTRNLDYIGALDIIKGLSYSGSPFDIPINYTVCDQLTGNLKRIFKVVKNDEFMRNFPTIFYEVQLSAFITCATAPIYGHEIAHSQFIQNPGIIMDYHNDELVPEFIESLIAMEIDKTNTVYNLIQQVRLDNLLRDLETIKNQNLERSVSLIDASLYTVSYLKSIKLMDIYLNGSDSVKREILDYIQLAFYGQRPVEDLLDRFNITLENSCDIELVRQRIKY